MQGLDRTSGRGPRVLGSGNLGIVVHLNVKELNCRPDEDGATQKMQQTKLDSRLVFLPGLIQSLQYHILGLLYGSPHDLVTGSLFRVC